MLVLKLLYLNIWLVIKLLEVVFPVSVELLQLLVSNVDVLLQLFGLDVDPEVVLVGVDVLLKQAHLSHQVFVQLVFMDYAQLVGEDGHLLFNRGEYENLLVLIQLTIRAYIKHFKELLGWRYPGQVENLNKKDKGIVCNLLFACSFQKQVSGSFH